jgi:hypothetical protein
VSQHTRAPLRAGAFKGLVADRCRRTPRDHTREGRDVPPCVSLRRAPSQPLHLIRSTSAPSQNTHASSPRAYRTRPGAPPTSWAVAGGSLARARGRARPNLGLPSSRLAPDRNSLCAGAGAQALRVLGASKGLVADRVRRTRRGRTRAGRAVPPCVSLRLAPPGPCSQDAPREPAALWARARAPRARGSAVTYRGGAVGVLGAGPAGRGAPGRCVLLSTGCDPSTIARSNLPFLEPFSNRFLHGGVPITCGFGESPAGSNAQS